MVYSMYIKYMHNVHSLPIEMVNGEYLHFGTREFNAVFNIALRIWLCRFSKDGRCQALNYYYIISDHLFGKNGKKNHSWYILIPLLVKMQRRV